MVDEKCPCVKNCINRTATCHSTCQLYRDWVMHHQAFKQSKFEEEEVSRQLTDTACHRSRRFKSRCRKN